MRRVGWVFLLAVLVVAAWGRWSSSDGTPVRGGVPSTIHRFEQVSPAIGRAERGPIPDTPYDGHDSGDVAELKKDGEIEFDQFHLEFSAFGKQFDIVLFGRTPTDALSGPECFPRGAAPDEIEGRVFFERHDGYTCRKTAVRSTSFHGRTVKPETGTASLVMRDGEWWGSLDVGGEVYVLRPRSLYDSYAPLGTVIVYRYSDADEF